MNESSGARVSWVKGGDAVVLALDASTISLRSSVPSPPGSRIDGTLAGGGLVRVKIHGSRRQDDGSFVLEGRPLDMTKELRERIVALLAAPPGGAPSGP